MPYVAESNIGSVWRTSSHARRVGFAADLCIGSSQRGFIEPCARIPSKIEFGLLDGLVVTLLEVVRQHQREAVEVVEFGIDAQCEFERLDGRVGLAQPHQDIPAAGERIGVIGIDGDSAIDLRLRFGMAVVGEIAARQQDARTDIRRVEPQGLAGVCLDALPVFVG